MTTEVTREPSLLRKYGTLLMRVRGDRLRVAILLAAMTAAAALEVLGIGLVMPFVALIQHPELAHTSRPLHAGLSLIGVHSPSASIIAVGLALLGAFVVKNAFLAFTTRLQARFIYRRLTLLAQALMKKYLAQPYTFFLRRNSAELVRNVTTSPTTVFGSGIVALFTMVVDGISCFVVAAFLVYLEPVAVPLVAAVVGVAAYALQRILRQRALETGRLEVVADGMMIRGASQAFGGIKEARVIGCEPYFARAFSDASAEAGQALASRYVVAFLPRYALETLGVLGMVLVTVVLLLRGESTTRLVPVLGVLALAVVRVLPAVARILTALSSYRHDVAPVELLYADLTASDRDEQPDDRDAPPLAFAHEIRITDVSYQYAAAASPAVANVSLTIAKGETIGLVGTSGAGKTTLADVLIGVLTATTGTVAIDDQPLDDATQWRRWQRLIGYIPQQVYLCDDTIRRNIAFGVSDDRIDEARVERALTAAQLGGVVAALPRGLDTLVGERGVRLSGGQRQRIGIARALYLEPQVLVLDEATSSLDGATEAEVVDAIEAARQDRTTIVIAHRLSTVRNCDRLVFMANGRVTDVGSWDALVAANADFRRLVELAGQH